MHIRDWPANERPREKLLSRGPSVLSDAELLAIFLGSGTAGRDAVATARDLLQAHGPLRGLLDRSPQAMTELPGLGPARACALAAALELGQRHLAAQLERGVTLSDPSAAGRYFAQRLRSQPREVFAALFLDTRHRALGFEALFHGSIDGHGFGLYFCRAEVERHGGTLTAADNPPQGTKMVIALPLPAGETTGA